MGTHCGHFLPLDPLNRYSHLHGTGGRGRSLRPAPCHGDLWTKRRVTSCEEGPKYKGGHNFLFVTRFDDEVTLAHKNMTFLTLNGISKEKWNDRENIWSWECFMKTHSESATVTLPSSLLLHFWLCSDDLMAVGPNAAFSGLRCTEPRKKSFVVGLTFCDQRHITKMKTKPLTWFRNTSNAGWKTFILEQKSFISNYTSVKKESCRSLLPSIVPFMQRLKVE